MALKLPVMGYMVNDNDDSNENVLGSINAQMYLKMLQKMLHCNNCICITYISIIVQIFPPF